MKYATDTLPTTTGLVAVALPTLAEIYNDLNGGEAITGLARRAVAAWQSITSRDLQNLQADGQVLKSDGGCFSRRRVFWNGGDTLLTSTGAGGKYVLEVRLDSVQESILQRRAADKALYDAMIRFPDIAEEQGWSPTTQSWDSYTLRGWQNDERWLG